MTSPPAAHRALLSLGSNVDPATNMHRAIDALQAEFPGLRCSPLYRTAAVGFSGPDFLNAAVVIRTRLPLAGLQHWIAALEAAQGRTRTGPRFSDRTLDVDILLYDDLVCAAPIVLPRPELLQQPFVLRPAADVAPDWVHPVAGQPLRILAEAMPAARSLVAEPAR